MNAVQCDYCGKFAPNPAARSRGFVTTVLTTVLPDGWWVVGAHLGGWRDGDTAGENGEFCSRECISAHFAKKAAYFEKETA